MTTPLASFASFASFAPLSKLTSCEDVVRCFVDETRGMTADQARAEMARRDSRIFTLSRMARRYHAALHAAPRFGLIGVGAITFAQNRLRVFIKRADIV